MNTPKRLLTTVLILALGLGIWGVAVTMKTAEFKAGDSLSAEGLNKLLNDNFANLQQAIASLEGKVNDLEGEVAALEAGKLDALSSRLPLVSGSIQERGVPVADTGTGSFTVSKSATGTYDIAIPALGEAGYNSDNFITLLQPYGGTSARRAAQFSADGKNLRVRVFDLDGNLRDTPFHFVVYPKP